MPQQAEPPKESSTMLYKILTTHEFIALPLPPTLWRGTTFDLQTSPPRLHLSTSRQVPRTLAAIFPDETELWLLAIPRTPRLDAMLEWEGDEGCAHVVLKDDQDGLDVWGEVAVRRPIKKEGDGWDTGELQCGERFRRGLQPLPPSNFHQREGRWLPSLTEKHRNRARASAVPAVAAPAVKVVTPVTQTNTTTGSTNQTDSDTYSGVVTFFYDEKRTHLFGYLDPAEIGYGVYEYTDDFNAGAQAQALIGNQSLLQILTGDFADTASRYWGFAANDYLGETALPIQAEFAPGVNGGSNFAFWTTAIETEPGAGPTTIPWTGNGRSNGLEDGYNAIFPNNTALSTRPFESAVWTVYPYGWIEPVWTNSDLSKVHVALWFDPQSSVLGISNSVEEYNKATGHFAFQLYAALANE